MNKGEEILRRREVLGWRLGLERMQRLCSLLGMPQNRFASIHVVGTNGKTSVTLMTAALLEAHGVSTGAYTSPHITDWRERIQIGGEPISPEAFDVAVERAEEFAQVADRAAGDEGPITQFELLTAAAFVAFAEARVQYAVIEAGLGGRLDATNVIPSKLTVLTSVSLDHTEYLGETLEEIAAEKLAVLRNHTMLVQGPVPTEVERVIERELERKNAHRRAIPGQLALPALPKVSGYQVLNFVIAAQAVSEVIDEMKPDGELIAALPTPPVPGRAELIQGDPPVIFDAAHNPDGARALAGVLMEHMGPELGSKPVCCIAVLKDKDARGIIEALASAVAQFVCTEVPPEAIEGSGRPDGRSLPADELARLSREAGVEAEAIPSVSQAWERARDLARERGAVALAAGSHYLLASIWTGRPDRSS